MKGPLRAARAAVAAGLLIFGSTASTDLYETTAGCDELAEPLSLDYRDSTTDCVIDPTGDADAFSFDGQIGDVVRVTVVGKSADLDPYVALRQQDNTILIDEGCDEAGSACSISATATLTSSGTHTIEVSDSDGDDTGNYVLQLERIPAAEPAHQPYEISRSGVIDPESDHDFYAFDGNDGTNVRVSAQAADADFDPRLEAWDAAGNSLGERSCDTGTAEAPCEITMDLTLTATGAIVLAISDVGNDDSGAYDLLLECIGDGCPDSVTALVSSVLPVSRSPGVNQTATAFATIINFGDVPAAGCTIAPVTQLPMDFLFQTADPTNNLTRQADAPVDIGQGQAQAFVMALTPTDTINPTDVVLAFDCINTDQAAVTVGLNTLLLSASEPPTADVIGLVATPNNNGIVDLPDDVGAFAAFSLATINVGAAGTVTATMDNGNAALPMELTICETTGDPLGQCLEPRSPTVTTSMATDAPATFAVFIQWQGNIPFDPANNRIFVQFEDATGARRGATSVAVRTVPGATPATADIVSGPETYTSAMTSTFEFTSTTGSLAFECKLDSQPWAPCTSPATYQNHAEGAHTFQVRSGGGEPDAWGWVVDTTPPNASIVSGPTTPTNSTTATFAFSADEPATFTCAVNGEPGAPCTSPATFTGLQNGARQFSVAATDAAGNVEPNAATFQWTVDTVPPDTDIVTGPAEITNEQDATFTFDSNEENATFECSVDGGPYERCGTPNQTAGRSLLRTAQDTFTVTFSSFTEGFHVVCIRAIDQATNVESEPACRTWFVDLTPPDFASIELASGALYTLVDELTARIGAEDNRGVTGYLTTDHNANDPENVVPPYADPELSDPAWVEVPSDTEYSDTVAVSLENEYAVGDTVEVCVWFRDQAGNISTRVCDDITWGVDWEGGIGNWSAENGVWQVGEVDNDYCFGGSQCAATVLNGNYPANTDSRLLSPRFDLPEAEPMEEIRLRFREAFFYRTGDSGQVQLCVWDSATSTCGDWVSVGSTVFESSDWSRRDIDLTAYAGQTIRLAFYHTADFSNNTRSSGWFIDNIQIVSGVPVFDGTFEVGDGWGDWSADAGIWQIGAVDGDYCFEGAQCAATRLNANYYANTDSRLISAKVELPAAAGLEEVRLRFREAFFYSNGDIGQVQLCVWDAATSTCGDWISVGSTVAATADWTRRDINLTAYAGQTIRLAFFHQADFSGSTVSAGWFIDDLQIVAGVPQFEGTFETGDGWGDWSADAGVWQIGAVDGDYCFEGAQCAATGLNRNYRSTTDGRLVSAKFELPSASGMEEVRLRFREAFFYRTGDSGQVQVCVWDNATSTCGAWISVGAAVFESSDWSRRDIDLTAYAGQTIRLAFFHQADFSNNTVSAGWFIDDVQIVTGVPQFDGTFEAGWGDWSADAGVWQIGAVDADYCFEGAQCAATGLNSNYYPDTDSRLVSAKIELPSASGMEEVRLRFREAFFYGNGDIGQVQICVWDAATATCGDWISVGSAVAASADWTRRDINLTPYAGQEIRLAFFHQADFSNNTVSAGWFIDDLQIVAGVPQFEGTFETGDGWGDWSADTGVWQIGAVDGDYCFEGSQCAATGLNRNYRSTTDGRLVSAKVELPSASGMEEVRLRFREAYFYRTGDSGQVQVCVWDSASSTCGAWTSVGAAVFESSDWSRRDIDLTAYAGQTIRLAFFHQADFSNNTVSSGWFIDDVQIVAGVPTFDGTFEAGDGWGDWSTDAGVWQIGAVDADYCFEGTQCAATRLNANYYADTDSRLISAPIQLPNATGGDDVHLRYRQAFFYASGDSGQVQICVWDTATSTCGSWIDVGTAVTGTSDWSQRDLILTAYAGQTIRLAFFHQADFSSNTVAAGWFVDEITFSVF